MVALLANDLVFIDTTRQRTPIGARPIGMLCMLLVGTGGTLTVDKLQNIDQWSGPNTIISTPSQGKVVPLDIARNKVTSVLDYLIEIKAILGLTIKQLSSLLNVERPTVYKWLDSTKITPPIRNENRSRIVFVHELATEWSKLSQYPLGHHLESLIVARVSLLEKLSDPTLDRMELSDILKNVALEVNESNKNTKNSDFANTSIEGSLSLISDFM